MEVVKTKLHLWVTTSANCKANCLIINMLQYTKGHNPAKTALRMGHFGEVGLKIAGKMEDRQKKMCRRNSVTWVLWGTLRPSRHETRPRERLPI